MKQESTETIVVEALEPTAIENRHPDYKLNKYFFLAIIVMFGIFLFLNMLEFFSAFLGAIMFYVLSKPFMQYLIKKKRWKKKRAAVLVITVLFLIIMLPIILLIMLLYEKIKIFLQDPGIIEKTLTNINHNIQTKYHVQLLTPENKANIQSTITHALSSLLNEGLNFFITITLLYFFLYFMLININRMEAAIVFFLPFKRNKIELFGKELVAQTFTNAVVVPLIAVAQGFIGFIGYIIAGLPEPGFWAVVTAFTTIIPVIGTALVWLPASVFLFVNGHSGAGIFLLIWGAIILGLTDNIIRFLLAKRMAAVHEVVTVLGIIIGLKSFGLPGLIFGPLLISYFIILLKIYYFEYRSGVPIKKKKSTTIRFNLPFLGRTMKNR